MYFLFKDYVNHVTENVSIFIFAGLKPRGKFSVKHLNCVVQIASVYAFSFWPQSPILNDIVLALYFYVWNLVILCILQNTSNPL